MLLVDGENCGDRKMYFCWSVLVVLLVEQLTNGPKFEGLNAGTGNKYKIVP
jgi:hypothetical protein